MTEEELSALVERYLDREATAEEVADLQGALRQDPIARERFWQAAEWHALYRQWGEQEWGRAAAREESRVVAMPTAPAARVPRAVRVGSPVSPGKIKRFPFVRWAAGIAAAAAMIIALTFLPSAVAPVATLERIAGAQWISTPIQEGSKLRPSQIALSGGAVVLALNRGARVILEGPAELLVRDDNTVYLRSGRLRASVPEKARGFKVETPDYTAVDLGTEFGCDVLRDGSSELHVFTGKVDLQPGKEASGTVRLGANQAMRVFHGVASKISPNRLKFFSEAALNLLDPRKKGDFHEAWRVMSQQLDADPNVVLHYDFQGPLDHGASNRASSGLPASRANIVGAQRTEGRWPGKAGLRFQSAEDRLEFALPGTFESLTLLAWIRIEDLHSGRNPILMGRGKRIGDVHWYLYRNGGIGVGVLSGDEAGQSPWSTYHSEPALLPKDYGRWMFVATVLNGATGTATHYLNGEPMGERGNIVRVPLQIGPAEMGNSIVAGRKPDEPAAPLSGSIDEAIIYRVPLSAEDIARLYRLGKPATR